MRLIQLDPASSDYRLTDGSAQVQTPHTGSSLVCLLVSAPFVPFTVSLRWMNADSLAMAAHATPPCTRSHIVHQPPISSNIRQGATRSVPRSAARGTRRLVTCVSCSGFYFEVRDTAEGDTKTPPDFSYNRWCSRSSDRRDSCQLEPSAPRTACTSERPRYGPLGGSFLTGW